uniref:Secreted protein n=1 Tax=Heterorhabditis bacteriophora TaxID=37862 RepID=A0A1I7WDA4_HETBA
MMEGKSGASSRGNSSSTSVNRHCSRSWILVTYFDSPLALIISRDYFVGFLLVASAPSVASEFTLNKLDVCLNARSWNNKRGLRFYLL